MLKAAIIGCGKIADSHAAQIKRIADCAIVGVCDREPLMAKQLADRFNVPRFFDDVLELLTDARPDVVHITTPPQSHFALGKVCLEHGAHIYVEKPFAVDAKETVELLQLAEKHGLKATAGHDDQFRPAARRMRKLVQDGYLGGAPVHMESYYCYDLTDPSYAKALLGDKQHWVRKLPGQLLQNIISHGIARIAEFLSSDDPRIISHGFVSPILRSIGETEIIDELRVIINENDARTAYFTFSSQMRPSLHQFRIYGTRNGIILDQDNETVLKLGGRRHKSYLEHFIPPVVIAGQLMQNWTGNIRRFFKNDFHMKEGMKHLIEAFYGSIRDVGPLPISYREIIRTSRIMDTIFAQLRPCLQNDDFSGVPARMTAVSS
jgi:predicted dehydrogenase